MSSRDFPDRLQLGRKAGGGYVAVGLPFNERIFIQEYFEGGAAYYAIANHAPSPATIEVRRWVGRPGERLLGPWTIAPSATVTVSLAPLEQQPPGSLLAIAREDGAHLGILRAPGPAPAPGFPCGASAWLTAEGLNGVGSRDDGVVVVQEQRAYTPGDRVRLRLSVPGGLGTVTFPSDDTFRDLPALDVAQATSATASITREDGRMGVLTSVAGAGRDVVDLEAVVPRDATALMVVLRGHVTTPSGSGFAFLRGFLMDPQ